MAREAVNKPEIHLKHNDEWEELSIPFASLTLGGEGVGEEVVTYVLYCFPKVLCVLSPLPTEVTCSLVLLEWLRGLSSGLNH